MRNKIIKRVLIGAFFFAICALVAGCFVDTRQAKNQASAVGINRQFDTLQKEYAAAHPQTGFACDARALLPADWKKDDWQGPSAALRFLTGEPYAGYRFTLTGCTRDSKGVAIHYKFAGVPNEPGKSGTYAYCTSEESVIWYDASGSAEACLANRKPLE
jgi:hypothetical protein